MQNQVSKRPYLCSELVSVTWENQKGEPHSVVGNLDEIGESSVLLNLDSALPRGTSIHISSGKYHLRGRVDSCKRDRLLGYYVEIRLNAESKWSAIWFTPQHLLALWNGVEIAPQQLAPQNAA